MICPVSFGDHKSGNEDNHHRSLYQGNKKTHNKSHGFIDNHLFFFPLQRS